MLAASLCYGGSEEGETLSGLRLDLKWLLAVLSSTQHSSGDMVMCYLVICGFISGFGVSKAKNQNLVSLSAALSFHFFHFLASLCLLSDTCIHRCTHSQAVKIQAKDDRETMRISSRFSCAEKASTANLINTCLFSSGLRAQVQNGKIIWLKLMLTSPKKVMLRWPLAVYLSLLPPYLTLMVGLTWTFFVFSCDPCREFMQQRGRHLLNVETL